MKNIYHKDIYKFEKPVKSYWEDTTKENFNLKRLAEDIKSEVVKEISLDKGYVLVDWPEDF